MRKRYIFAISLFIHALAICFSLKAESFFLKKFLFDEADSLDHWKEMVIDGDVHYYIDLNEDNGFVHADSKQACSAIYYRIGFKPQKYPILSWKWCVLKFPSKNITGKDPQDDYAIRVYAIFPSWSFSSSKFIEYIWSEHLPEGLIQESPVGKNIRQIIVRSGAENLGKWVSEKRNIYDDYEKAFGKESSRSVGAIAIMCNANITKSEAEALVDDITIGTETAVKWRLSENEEQKKTLSRK